MDIVLVERPNMEQRKRKPNDAHFPIEFTSPFSLQECLSRLPEKIVRQISENTYEFELKPDIDKERNQFINVYGYLERVDETTTRIIGESRLSLTFYIFALIMIPVIATGISQFTGSLLTGIIITILGEGLLTLFLRRDQKQLGEAVFATFRSPLRGITKPHRTLFFAWLKLDQLINLPFDACVLRLQKLTFLPTIFRMMSRDENEYHFNFSGLFGYWSGVSVKGCIIREGQNSTRVTSSIGASYEAYGQLVFMLIVIVVLGLSREIWHDTIPLALVLFPPLFILFHLFNAFTFRRLISKALE
jgi:hypothetical protein